MKPEELYSRALGTIPADPADWAVEDVPVRNFCWRVFTPRGTELPSQGWKLHVSCSADEIERLVARVTPILIEKRVAFKLPAELVGLTRLNDGVGGLEQRGKILTVYPVTENGAAVLLRELDLAWPGSQGPRVSGEARLRRDSPVSARYGAFEGRFAEDEFGRPERLIVDEQGAAVVDKRAVMHRDPARLDRELRVFDEELESQSEVQAGRERFLPLRLLRQGTKKVYAGIEVTSLESVILKAAPAGTQAEEQLRNEHRFLVEIETRCPGAGLAPRARAFVAGAPSVLVLEEVGGRTLAGAGLEAQVKSLPALANAVALLHSAGIVHRDLKLENVVLDGERVRLIDFDAAAFVGDENPPALGTFNHFGPEGSASVARAAYDVYSLGVCIAHVLLQWNPGMLPEGDGRIESLLRFRRVPEALVALVHSCTAADPAQRPNATEVATRLREHLGALEVGRLTDFAPALQTLGGDKPFEELAQAAGRVSRRYRASSAGGWRNEHMAPDYVYEGVNLGAAGIMLGLLSLDVAGGRREFAGDIEDGARWLARRAPQVKSHGLFTGNAGVALALSVVGRRAGDERLVAAARARLAAAVEGATEIDLFSGKAGVLYAATAMSRVLGEDRLLDDAAPIVEQFLATAEMCRGVLGWRSTGRLDEEREVFTGPAHGAAGIALALATWAQISREKEVEDFSINVLKSVWSNARTDDRTTLRRFVAPHSPDGFKRAWCHGTAGHLWSTLVAFGDDPRFSGEIDEMVSLLRGPAPLGNPTYCHGFAGELELWRMVSGLERHRELGLRKARETAEVLRLLASSRQGESCWHSEEPVTFTPDLWVGFLGPASALALWGAGRQEALLSIDWLKRLSSPVR